MRTTADTAGSRHRRSTPARPTDASRGAHDPTLTEVGAGTPMGELLRRYWHPIGADRPMPADTPRQVRVLGEDLILFRDKQRPRRAGPPHCAHRGASLYYGRVEERGIRCCYHGWLFDVEGHCVEQPCEPDLGARRAARVPAAVVPGRGALRPGLGLPRPAREEAGAAALRRARAARRRRVPRGRRRQHRRWRAARSFPATGCSTTRTSSTRSTS